MAENKRIKLFTHTDLDGVGSAVIAKAVEKQTEGRIFTDVTYCDYNNVNEIIMEFLNSKSYAQFDHVFITDISVNEEIADYIQEINNKAKEAFVVSDIDILIGRILLIDHHATAEWLNEYDWAYVNPYYNMSEEKHYHNNLTYQAKTCGTSLFLKFFMDFLELESIETNLNEVMVKKLEGFTSLVRLYDTWQWEEVYGGERLPKSLNVLFWAVGRDLFVESMVSQITDDKAVIEDTYEYGDIVWSNIFTKEEYNLVQAIHKEVLQYIGQKSSEMLIIPSFKGHVNVGVVTATKHISELGNELCKLHPYLSFVVIINKEKGKVSLRTIKESVNLSLIAKEFGGGGHPKASGLEYTKAFQKELAESQPSVANKLQIKENKNILDILIKKITEWLKDLIKK